MARSYASFAEQLIGRRFAVRGSHLHHAPVAGRITLTLDAGLAFGSGEHGSTRGALRALEFAARRRPRRVIDVGTGSGILALAAARLLHRRVLAVDIEPQSVRVARSNAKDNRLGPLIATRVADGWRAPGVRRAGPYDLVLANILARPLRQMAWQLCTNLAPGGRVILGGFLRKQARDVLAAHRRRGLRLELQLQEAEWTTLLLQRPGASISQECVMTAEMSDRLARLRQELSARGLSGFIVPRADEHLGEYVPASAERLAWLTGFTGSAGLAAVLPDKAAAFTDGRYVLQLAAQTKAELWERRHITEDPPPAWLAANAPAEASIGYDPLLISEEGLAGYTDAGLSMVPVEGNPIDAIWRDRPRPPVAPAVPHPLEYAGRSADEKREQIAGLLRDAKQDAAVITDPASIAWLLNIRGGDVPYTPFVLGFALVHADGRTELFLDPAKLPDPTRAWLGNAVSVAGRAALEPALRRLAGKRVRVDRSGSAVWFAQSCASRRGCGGGPRSLSAAEGVQE